ncbi:SUMF1/EgtB/PvdO family nonheme iron enzyme [Gracilinema caldarium]|uniref:phage major tropism determinant n=1 Tax=Gracilinema caldarium TaxID=215591 RepID=UPI0026ED7410|nr:SUMF1/EgtB/PvdO family nonheme iron enzyme [Gracilinema caldarium]
MHVYRVKDYVDDASVAWLALFHDIKATGKNYLEKKNPFSYSENKLVVKKDTVISLLNEEWKIFTVMQEVELSEADLDEGSFQVGVDYYVYLCDNGGDGIFLISANSTYPSGFNASSSRKVGGFHYGHIRKVSPDGLWIPIDGAGVKFGAGTPGWRDNVTVGIVPNSVWDLKNKPLCSPEGMVKVGRIWVDIYLSSAAEPIALESGTAGLHIASGKLQSKYGQVPVSGTEGLNWYGFQELASRAGKRLLTYGEWIQAAFGSPQGLDGADTYGWTKTSNGGRTRTGCQVNASSGAYDPSAGIKPASISAYNCVDCVGNLWEWLDDISNRHDSTSWAWLDVLGSNKGQAYLPNNVGVAAYIAGARWADGVRAGARAVSVSSCPWGVHSGIGSRLVCDSL